MLNRHYLFKQRQQQKVKNRSEIKCSTRKIYRQKGTGGARHGARNAPQFRGGGVALGPVGNQNFFLGVNKKLKKKVLSSCLKRKLDEKKIFLINSLSTESFKTREAKILLKNIALDSKKLLIVLENNNTEKKMIMRSFRNLPLVTLTDSNSLNSYQIFSHNLLLFTPDSVSEIENRLK